MNKQLNRKIISGVTVAALLLSGAALPVFAAGITSLGVGINASATATVGGSGVAVGAGVNAHVTAAIAKLITTAQSRADEEITRRVNALDALNTRVNAMVKISDSDKSALSSNIATQITAMNTLQAQIAADAAANSTTSLKADIQSITKSYRIFILIIPQGAIEAAADRVLDVADMMMTLGTQLQTRITAAQAAGNDMSVEVSALADMNAKITDANTQANAAVSEVASLQPDNGSATVEASNTAALKDAHTKVQAGQQDLVAARKDAGTIVKALLALKVSATASSTVTASGTAQ